jgi:hypothetical protein
MTASVLLMAVVTLPAQDCIHCHLNLLTQ